MYKQRLTAARGIPVLWLSCAIVIARRWSEKALTTARPRAMEVIKLGSVSASISCAMVSGGVGAAMGIAVGSTMVGGAMTVSVGSAMVGGASGCSVSACSGGKGSV